MDNAQPSVPQKFRIKDAAKIIGLSYSCVRAKIQRGEIGVEKLGRSQFVYLAEIEAFKRRRQVNFHCIV